MSRRPARWLARLAKNWPSGGFGDAQRIAGRVSCWAITRPACRPVSGKDKTMKEDFAYSKRMHQEKTVKPAQRKARKEMAVAQGFVGVLAFIAFNGYVLHWF